MSNSSIKYLCSLDVREKKDTVRIVFKVEKEYPTERAECQILVNLSEVECPTTELTNNSHGYDRFNWRTDQCHK